MKRRRKIGHFSLIFVLCLQFTKYSAASSRNRSFSFDSSPLYFSDDEKEERILSALERIDQSTDDEWVESSVSGRFTSEDEEQQQGDEQAHSSSGDVSRDYLNMRERIYIEKAKQSLTSIGKQTPSSEVQRAASEDPKPESRSFEYVPLPKTYRVDTATAKKTTKQETASVSQINPSVSMTTPWIRQFLASCPKDVLLPVPIDFWLDNFNLAQLAPVIENIAGPMHQSDAYSDGRSFPVYREALRLITQQEPVPGSIPDYVLKAAKALYLLVHQRYILSPRGLDTVRRRFLIKPTIDPIFGRCPRIGCRGMPLLPYGDSNDFDVSCESRAKRYCASCNEVFYHWDSKVDGCAWGTSFCNLFLMTCGEDLFRQWRQNPPRQSLVVPRIFGFRLHPSSLQQ